MSYAGFWRRLVAATVDQFIIGLVAYFLGHLLALIATYLPPFSEAKTTTFFNYGAIGGYLVLGFIYFVWLEGQTGVTVGKRLLNLKLVRNDQPNRDGIGFLRAAIRLIAAFVLQFFAGINFIFMLISPLRQTLHDKEADTIVVYDPKGAFATFDPDKLAAAPTHRTLFIVVLILSVLGTIGQVVYWSSLL